jgi:hypothetical protein
MACALLEVAEGRTHSSVDLEMERTMKLGIVVCSVAFLLLACGGAHFTPLVAHRTWQTDDSAKVFDATVRVLHGQDFMIASADKSSGLISTDWKEYAADDGWKYKMRMNLLVLKETEGYVALDFKSKVQALHAEKTHGEWRELEANDPIDAEGFRKMNRELDDFFLEVQRYAGPSVQRR